MASDPAAEFARLVDAIVVRFSRQNDPVVPPAPERARLTANLWRVAGERGWPRPLAAHERGAPGELSDAELAPLLARVLDGVNAPLLQEAGRQLLKACVYPEFKTCRDSFREVAADGSCRRQEFTRARRRVSGAHCVDCPHWVALTPAQHERFLARAWRVAAPGLDPAATFRAHQAVFLPEDFRALRRWIYAAARAPGLKRAGS